jgi:hypothetical protein
MTPMETTPAPPADTGATVAEPARQGRRAPEQYVLVQTSEGTLTVRADRVEESPDGGLFLAYRLDNPFGGAPWERALYLVPGGWKSYRTHASH